MRRGAVVEGYGGCMRGGDGQRWAQVWGHKKCAAPFPPALLFSLRAARRLELETTTPSLHRSCCASLPFMLALRKSRKKGGLLNCDTFSMEKQPDLMGVPRLPEEAVLEQIWHAILQPLSYEMLWEAEEMPPENLPIERFVNAMALRVSSRKFRQLVDSTVEGTSLRLAIYLATSQGLELEKEDLLCKVYRHYVENLMLFYDEMEVETCPLGSALLTTPHENLSVEQLAELKMHLKEGRCGRYAPFNTLPRFSPQQYVPPPSAPTRSDWGFLFPVDNLGEFITWPTLLVPKIAV